MIMLRYILFTVIALLLVLGGALWLYLQQDKFGRLPEGARLNRLRQSSNYQNGTFQNQVPFREIVKGGSSIAGLVKYLLRPRENTEPPAPVPALKTDLKHLERSGDVVVWLGHSSYFVQLGGKTMLIDPVFSVYASPVFFNTRAFAGTNPYTVNDMPDIDYLLVSHDHWDHLDHDTVMALRGRIRHVITGLGVGEHFARWGFPASIIHEMDWNESLSLDEGLRIHFMTARHYSGRLLTRNKTLWGAFALQTPGRRIFHGGDSGYGPHFKAIGESFGSFDLALLDSGQYDEAWHDVHMMPEEAAQAAVDLGASAALPGHDGKFCISFHAWDDPFRRFTAAAVGKPFRAVTPRIGEVVDLADHQQSFAPWWERIAAP